MQKSTSQKTKNDKLWMDWENGKSHLSKSIEMLDCHREQPIWRNQRSHFVLYLRKFRSPAKIQCALTGKIIHKKVPITANNNKGAFWLSNQKEYSQSDIWASK